MESSLSVVGMRHGGVVRSILDQTGIFGRLTCNLTHGLDKAVECFAALGLGRLNHQRFMEKQREVDCRGVEAEIEQTFGHIERGHAGRLVFETVEHKLMLARSGYRQFVEVGKLVEDIVGVECGQRSDCGYSASAKGQDIG